MTVPGRGRPLTAGELADLPVCGPYCPHGDLTRAIDWATGTEERFGWCGVRFSEDGATIGYLLLAAPGLAPQCGPYRTAATSPDAAVLVRVWIDPQRRGRGLGRQLVQRAAAAAHRAGIPAIEAIGGVDAGPCAVAPLPWLRRAGFTVVRNHPLHPRVRLDLDTTVRLPRWSAVVDRIRSLVRRPQAPPQPTGRSGPRPTAARTARVHVPS